jgi:hypothetical protein
MDLSRALKPAVRAIEATHGMTTDVSKREVLVDLEEPMRVRPMWLVASGLTFAAAVCILMCVRGTPGASAQSESESRAESVLLERFETVVYTKTELIAPVMAFLTKGEDIPADVSESMASLTAPFFELGNGLRVLGPNVEKDIERNYGTILVGARDFGYEPTGPEGLGPTRSHKCYIGVSRGGAKPNMESDFRNASKASVSGRTVWVWPVPSKEGPKGPDQWFAVQVTDLYFLISNDRQAFEETANALASTTASKPAPIHAEGWETLRTQEYWAYRSFRSESVANLKPDGGQAKKLGIIALTFYVDNQKKDGRIQVFSSDTRVTPAPAMFPEPVPIQLQSQGAGVWGATIPLPNRPTDDKLFALMSQFGFGANL